MKILKEMKKLNFGLLLILSMFLSSCVSNFDSEIGGGFTKEGKFSLSINSKVFSGFLKIEKIHNDFYLKISSFDNLNRFRINFSEEKIYLGKKEVLLFTINNNSNLKKLNFFKLLNWAFELCDNAECLMVKEENFFFVKTQKAKSTLIEASDLEETFSLKIFIE